MPDPSADLDVRSHFPGAECSPYLDVAARGLLPQEARDELHRYLDQRVAGTVDKAHLFAAAERSRELFATLIAATPDEIALTRNVTDGISTFASALPWEAGDGVVLCRSIEHPANIFPWYGLRRRMGIHIKNVCQVDGEIPLDAILSAIDGSTRVVAVSSISFAPGFRLPVAALGAECRRRGVFLLVDAAQSTGIMATDVNEWQVDALATSTQKGLMGLYGMGFLFVRAATAATLNPLRLSRFGVDITDGHEADAGDPDAYQLAQAARRFDLGNYNYAAILAVNRSLELLLSLGITRVERYVFGLAREFATRMLDEGLPVYGGAPGPHGSHIVTVGRRLGVGHDSAQDNEMSALYGDLTSHGVRLGIRRDLLRFSFHIYNNQADVDEVVRLSRTWLRARRPAVAMQGT